MPARLNTQLPGPFSISIPLNGKFTGQLIYWTLIAPLWFTILACYWIVALSVMAVVAVARAAARYWSARRTT